MKIAHIDPAQFNSAMAPHDGAGALQYMTVLGNDDFGTNWMFIHAGVVPPGVSIGHHRHECFEECYLIFDGAARFTHNGNTAELRGGVAAPLRLGESHGIYNHTDEDVPWLNIGVSSVKGEADAEDLGEDLVDAVPGDPELVPHQFLDRTLLEPNANAHGGVGEIYVNNLWKDEDFRTNLKFIAYVIVPPECSIGYHRHETVEEVYLFLSGGGRMVVDDEVKEVTEGDCVLNQLGGSHGFYNPTHDPCELLVACVTQRKGIADSTDLGDDLTTR